jgi:hypothetical protein
MQKSRKAGGRKEMLLIPRLPLLVDILLTGDGLPYAPPDLNELNEVRLTAKSRRKKEEKKIFRGAR